MLRYVSDLQSAVSQINSNVRNGSGQHTVNDRHDSGNTSTININDRNRLGLSDLSGVNLNERLMQERVAHNRLVQERVLQERAIQERALQERALQERAIQERALQERALQERAIQERALQERALQESRMAVQNRSALHQTLIIPTSHVISTSKTSGNTSAIQQNNIASPGPV